MIRRKKSRIDLIEVLLSIVRFAERLFDPVQTLGD